MSRNAPENIRIKRKYLEWLRQAKGLSEASVDKAAASIDRWLDFVKGADFRKFHTERAIAFKRHLEAAKTPTRKSLTDASRDGILRDLKAFHLWLADQSGYRSKIRHTDAQWFTPDRRTARAAHQGQWRPHPSPEQVYAAVFAMPSGTIIERRDRALMAFLLLTSSRETAAMTVKLRHIDLPDRCVHFDGKGVETKNNKRFTTFFFPVAEAIHDIFVDWIKELRSEVLFGPTDPVFPKTDVRRSARGVFEAVGVLREPWASPGAIVRIFKQAFISAGLPPFSPHRIRNTLVDLGSRYCKTPEDFKAWSQNMAHDDVLTTFRNYGQVAPGRQGEIISRMRDHETS